MVNDFIAALDLRDVTLVGNDTGGGLCQLLIDAHPDSVGRLVLTNCDAFDKFPPFPFNVVFAIMRGPRSIRAAVEADEGAGAAAFAAGLRAAAAAGDDALTASWVEPMQHRPADRAEPRHAVAWRRRNGSHRRGDPAAPLRQAGHDGVGSWPTAASPRRSVARLAALFPNAAMVEVPDARTFVALDAPAAVVDAIATVGARLASR